MHSKVFVINNAEISEEEVYEGIRVCDYAIQEDEEGKKDSIEWLRRTYLSQENNNSFFNEADVKALKDKILGNIKNRFKELKKKILKIEEQLNTNEKTFSWGFLLWELTELSYPQTEFFFVVNNYALSNEIEFLDFLEKAKEFEITETYDYHF